MLLALEAREVNVVAGDALDRGEQVLEGVLVDAGDDLGGDAAGARAFVNDHAPAGLGDGRDERLGVHRRDREQVDHLGVDVVQVAQVFGGFERWPHHGPVGDQREVGALAHDPGLADGRRFRLLGDLLLEGPVDGLGLVEDHRVGIVDCGVQQ